MRLVIALVAVGLAGCTVLAPRPDPSRFYTLSPRVPEAADPSASAGGPSVIVGPVSLPAYLDRNEIALRVSPNELDYARADRWAEPLVQNLTRVLVENLGRALATERVAALTDAPSFTPDFWVEVVVVRFEAGASGEVRLTARWAVRDAKRAIVRIRQSQHLEQAGAATVEAGVAAQSAVLAELALEIAALLRELAPRR